MTRLRESQSDMAEDHPLPHNVVVGTADRRTWIYTVTADGPGSTTPRSYRQRKALCIQSKSGSASRMAASRRRHSAQLAEVRLHQQVASSRRMSSTDRRFVVAS